jgi:hypothetical protein
VPRQRRALAGKSGIKIFPMNQMNEPRLTSLSHGGRCG